MMNKTSNDEFIGLLSSEMIQRLKIAGEDTGEINLSKRQISAGHDGTVSSSAVEANAINTFEHRNWFHRQLHHWSVEDKLLICGSAIIEELRGVVCKQLKDAMSIILMHVGIKSLFFTTNDDDDDDSSLSSESEPSKFIISTLAFAEVT
jgi:hypothetical protein